jgi:L-alanine-DL-glutamate epimerase-like enolase superfamily enzyme
VQLSARIVSLELAETFTIARGSQDTADVVRGRDPARGVSGFGEAAPIERYHESAESALAFVESVAGELGDDPFALDDVMQRLPDDEFARGRRSTPRCTTSAGSCSASRSGGCSGSSARAADLLDDRARRRRDGREGGEGARERAVQR